MIYECDKCGAALPPGVTACPKCGDSFDEAVPMDAEVPAKGFTARPTLIDPPPSSPAMTPGGAQPAPHPAYPWLDAPAAPSPRPVARKKTSPVLGCLALILAIGVLVAVFGSHDDNDGRTGAPPAPTASGAAPTADSGDAESAPAPVRQAPPAAPHWVTVATFRGDAIKKTPPFTVGDHWQIQWATRPGSMGSGNFQIYVNKLGEDGGGDVAANIIGAGHDTSDEYSAGTYYLEMNTDQPYVVRVLDERQ